MRDARKFPEKPALVVGEHRITYAELDERAVRLANVLRDRGVKRGDRVVILADSSVPTVTAIFGSLKAGAIFCPINPSVKVDKLTYVLNNCRAKALVTPASLLQVAASAIGKAPSITTTLVHELPPGHDVRCVASLSEAMAVTPASEIPHAGIDIDLAMLVYTSGSTGLPKGVMMTHQNVVAAATSITQYLENTSDDIIACALPLSFDYGLYQVLMAAKVGATVVLEKSFAYPAAVLQKMRREQATGFPLVPTMAALLLRMKELEPGSLPQLRYITNTAAALPPRTLLGCESCFLTHAYTRCMALRSASAVPTWLPMSSFVVLAPSARRSPIPKSTW